VPQSRLKITKQLADGAGEYLTTGMGPANGREALLNRESWSASPPLASTPLDYAAGEHALRTRSSASK
jgi:hypothetical protein